MGRGMVGNPLHAHYKTDWDNLFLGYARRDFNFKKQTINMERDEQADKTLERTKLTLLVS